MGYIKFMFWHGLGGVIATAFVQGLLLAEAFVSNGAHPLCFVCS